jgi:DNA-binding NarL/FixJ family response regulator
VLLIDEHEFSRSACRALLRTEGAEVADHGVGEDAIALTAKLAPDAVILDVTPDDDTALGLGRRLRELENGPTVLLTSSADPAAFGTRLGGFCFISKTDLCTSEIRNAIQSLPIRGKS